MAEGRPVVTRFAPSPTGILHIGNVRTAFFAWLFARQHQGKFILRIEDTDRGRFVQEALDDILATLGWLGLGWDEGPVFQSERLSHYLEHAERLLGDGKAYRCFCSKERLDEVRQQQQQAKQNPGYDRHCRDLAPEEVQRKVAEGAPSVVRFKTPLDGQTLSTDLLRGEIRVENSTIDDFVLLKSDGFPTYHLAHVVDDRLMGVSHVIRGEEWIPSLPRHQLLHDALGWDPPTYVHMTVLLDPEGGKMSKRKLLKKNLPFAMRDFRSRGYLPDAVANFMALLGWGPSDNQEILSREELIRDFRLEGMSKSSPVFSFDKLDRFNGIYIRKLTDEQFVEAIVPFLVEDGLLAGDATEADRALLLKVAPLVKERVGRLTEAADWVRCFFVRQVDYGDTRALVPKKMDAVQTIEVLQRVRDLLAAGADLDADAAELQMRELAKELGVKVGGLFMAVRVAVTGSTVSPPLLETMQVFGTDEVLKRLDGAAAALQQAASRKSPDQGKGDDRG